MTSKASYTFAPQTRPDKLATLIHEAIYGSIRQKLQTLTGHIPGFKTQPPKVENTVENNDNMCLARNLRVVPKSPFEDATAKSRRITHSHIFGGKEGLYQAERGTSGDGTVPFSGRRILLAVASFKTESPRVEKTSPHVIARSGAVARVSAKHSARTWQSPPREQLTNRGRCSAWARHATSGG